MLIQLLIIQLITFGGLIVALRVLFYRHLNSAIKRLKILHEENLIKETQLQEELKEAKKQRLNEVEKGKREAAKIIERAKKETEALRISSEKQARQESQKILTQSKQETEKLKTNISSEIENKALNLAIKMIKYSFTEQGIENFQHYLFEELINEINGLSKDKFSLKTDKVKVISSYPLADKERHELEKMLSQKVNPNIVLEQEIDPELITGFIIQIGALVIDGSLKNRLKKVIQAIR